MLKIKKHVELGVKYVENRAIYVDFEGIYVENGGHYVKLMVNICWSKNKERGISPLQNTFKQTRNYRFTIGIIMPKDGSDSSALR